MMGHNNIDNLFEQWHIRIKEDAEDEWDVNENRRPILLDRNSRSWIWFCCTYLDLLEVGVPGQVCRMIEFYLSEKLRRYNNGNRTDDELAQYKSGLTNRFPVLLAGSIIIASNLYHTHRLSPETLQECLVSNGFPYYTEHEIDVARRDVLEVHDFTMPTYSTIQIAELFAHAAGVPIYTFNFMRVVGNVAEFMRYRVDHDLRGSLDDQINDDDRILSIDLAAACVYAAVKHLGYLSPDTLSNLTDLTLASANYLISLADVLLYYVVAEGFV